MQTCLHNSSICSDAAAGVFSGRGDVYIRDVPEIERPLDCRVFGIHKVNFFLIPVCLDLTFLRNLLTCNKEHYDKVKILMRTLSRYKFSSLIRRKSLFRFSS